MGHWSLMKCAVVGVLIVVVVVGLNSPVHADGEPQILVSFDEIGSLPCIPELPLGQVLNIYVTGHDLTEISGFEFEMAPSHAPSFFLGKQLYRASQLDLGVEFSEYEVRAATHDCITDPTQMGPSPWSWTLVRYDLLYFVPETDVVFCLASAPSSTVHTPLFTLCDEDRTPIVPRPIDWEGPSGSYPQGCALAQPEEYWWYSCHDVIPTAEKSWGTLKSQYR